MIMVVVIMLMCVVVFDYWVNMLVGMFFAA